MPDEQRLFSDRDNATARPTRHIDPCPTCHQPVTVVNSEGSRNFVRYRAQPCGHPVSVTMWPDRVELDRP